MATQLVLDPRAVRIDHQNGRWLNYSSAFGVDAYDQLCIAIESQLYPQMQRVLESVRDAVDARNFVRLQHLVNYYCTVPRGAVQRYRANAKDASFLVKTWLTAALARTQHYPDHRLKLVAHNLAGAYDDATRDRVLRWVFNDVVMDKKNRTEAAFYAFRACIAANEFDTAYAIAVDQNTVALESEAA